MSKNISKLETTRRDGTTQVDYQRRNILDSAEKLFLTKGLENTSMSDIAAEAGITRVSLYRYFSDRHPIAFEIAVRMLKKISESSDTGERPVNVEVMRGIILRMIDQFYDLRDAHRFLGMFDHLYADRYPNETLQAWYKEQLDSLAWGEKERQDSFINTNNGLVAMIFNSTNSFLQKMAIRGDLMANEQGAPLGEQLKFYKEMVNVYFDQLAAQHSGSN